MQYAHILLALGGDGGNQVGKYFVTPAEVLILQAVHGDQAVTEVDVIDFTDKRIAKNMTEDQIEEYEDRTTAQDLARLREEYRHARVDDGNGGTLLVVSSLFPGAGAQAPENFADIDTIPDEFYKAEERKVPEKAEKKSAKKSTTKAEKEAEVETDNKADADKKAASFE